MQREEEHAAFFKGNVQRKEDQQDKYERDDYEDWTKADWQASPS